MIEYFWPSLLDLGFVVSMVTPIIKATKGTRVESFYTDSAYRDWAIRTPGVGSWRIKFYKGLGTSTSKEAQEYFKALSSLTVGFVSDEKAKESIVLAFDKSQADQRKTWLLESSQRKDLEVAYGAIKNLSVTDFVHRDLVHFR